MISKTESNVILLNINLNSFEATSGQTDISATGTIKNLIGFLMNKNKLQGDFNVKSDVFAVSDFMVAKSETAQENKTTSNKQRRVKQLRQTYSHLAALRN
mgnify:CR=1 FL=1